MLPSIIEDSDGSDGEEGDDGGGEEDPSEEKTKTGLPSRIQATTKGSLKPQGANASSEGRPMAVQYLEVFEMLTLIAIFEENSTQLWLLKTGTLRMTKRTTIPRGG
jgi:hypothetical protein